MPRRKVTSITRSGKRSEVLGIRELEAKIIDIKGEFTAAEMRKAGFSFATVINEATDEVYNEVLASAMSVGLPHDAIEDIFSRKKPAEGISKRIASNLVGVRKMGRMIGSKSSVQTSGSKNRPKVRKWSGRGYREWSPGKSWLDVAGKKAAGFGGDLTKRGSEILRKGLVSDRLIGESLATMWEIGTSKMPARPWFRPAVKRVASAVRAKIAAGLQAILDMHCEAA